MRSKTGADQGCQRAAVKAVRNLQLHLAGTPRAVAHGVEMPIAIKLLEKRPFDQLHLHAPALLAGIARDEGLRRPPRRCRPRPSFHGRLAPVPGQCCGRTRARTPGSWQTSVTRANISSGLYQMRTDLLNCFHGGGRHRMGGATTTIVGRRWNSGFAAPE